MISRRGILKAGMISAAAISAPYIARADTFPIRVGEINSYVHGINRFTVPYRKGWTLALEEINISGGINGRKLEIISLNDHAKPEEAARLAKFLVEKEKVSLLFGTYLSHIGLSVAQVAHDLKTPFIAAEPLTDKITMERGNPFTFRVRPSTYMQANMLAKEAAKQPVNRWACIAPDYEYGRAAVKAFKEIMEAARPDVEWVHDAWFPLFEIDAPSTIAELSKHKTDAIFNVSFSEDLEELILEGDKSDFFQDKSVTSLLSGEPEYLNRLTSPSCDGWVVTGYPFNQIETHAHTVFVKAYQSRFEADPALGSLVGYTTLKAIASLLKQSDGLSADKLTSALRSLYFHSPLGMLHFRASDHQSSMGTFVGRLEHIDGRNRMKDWYYADGANFWPSENDVKQRRPDF